MHGWWILVGAVIVAGTAIAPRLLRRHRRRVQVDRVTEALSTWLPALKQPDGTGSSKPPTEDHLSRTTSPRQVAPAGCAVRPRIRVVLSARDLSTTLAPPMWRMR